MTETDYKFKILLLGPPNVGKTSLLNRFVNETFDKNYEATIGAQFLTKQLKIRADINKSYSIQLNIWDIAGQKRFEDLRTTFYRGAQGALLIFDLTRESTFDDIHIWYSELMKVLSNAAVPFILIGNKLDLIKRKKRKIEFAEAEKYAHNKNSIYIETSAKTGDNVDSAFYELARLLLQTCEEIETLDQFPSSASSFCVSEPLYFKSKIQDYLKTKRVRVSSDVLDGSILNQRILEILDRSINRAKLNNRKTVMARDL